MIKHQLRLIRFMNTSEHTLGVLLDDSTGLPICFTLELPYKDNRVDESCIPCGAYVCSHYSSDRFKDAYYIGNVEGRSNILIHKGNSLKETTGCILVGKSMKQKGLTLKNSQEGYDRIKRIVGKERFTLFVERRQ